MTAFYLLHPISRAGIFLLLLILFILNLYILFVVLMQTKSYKTFLAVLLPLLLCYVALVVLTAALYEFDFGREPHPVAGIFARLPMFIYLLLILLVGTFTLFLLYREIWHRRNNLTRASIKESADNLPAGLCFATGMGIVLLSNRRMDDLCHVLTGRDLQDAEDFWYILTDGELQEGARRVADTKTPIICLADGRTWSFTRSSIEVDGRSVIQITAVDSTDLAALRIRLQNDNQTLTEMNARLRCYGENIANLTASEERLATKIRLHDELGHTFITMQHLLSKNTVSEESQSILELWKRNITVLRGGCAVNEAADWQKLIRFADNVGVIFQIDGSPLPCCKSADLIFGGNRGFE